MTLLDTMDSRRPSLMRTVPTVTATWRYVLNYLGSEGTSVAGVLIRAQTLRRMLESVEEIKHVNVDVYIKG